jgi:hypothetical protein
MAEVGRQRSALARAKPSTKAGAILKLELDLAARMAVQSCRVMLWQQALAAGRLTVAGRLARSGIRELRSIERDFLRYWPTRNKGTTARCSPFLQWRIADYRRGKLHFPPEAARQTKPKTYAAE